MDSQTGEILRLIETVNGGEVITDLGDYEFIADANGKITSVVLGEGVTLDLTTGKMKLEEGVSYEIAAQRHRLPLDHGQHRQKTPASSCSSTKFPPAISWKS